MENIEWFSRIEKSANWISPISIWFRFNHIQFYHAVYLNRCVSIYFQMRKKILQILFFVNTGDWILLFTILGARFSAQLTSCLPSVRKSLKITQNSQPKIAPNPKL